MKRAPTAIKGKGKSLFQTADDSSELEEDCDTDESSSTSSSNQSNQPQDAINLIDLHSEQESAVNLIRIYELNDNSTEVTVKCPESTKLPVYEAVLNGNQSSKTIIDSGATTCYISEQSAASLGAEIQRIRPRKVLVADKELTTVTGVVRFEMKLGDLPKETITAYTFPLAKVNLVLGLPWLRKHNPRVDWWTLGYEFLRNGRRYLLHPTKPPPNIRIADAKEFRSFVDEDTSLYLLTMDMLKNVTMEKEQKERDQELKKEQKLLRKLRRWIERKCPDLLRPIGKPADLEPFDIDTGDHPPIKLRGRPYSPLDLKHIKEFIEENLRNGIIEESDSSWSFPLVLAKKPDGGIRVCVDYRALNQITRKDAHSLPRIDESLVRFYGMCYFTTIDLRSGYWQILLTLAARAKTAFTTRYSHYQWRVLPFGLTNAPAAFQRRMIRLLRPFLDKFCCVYLDDIIIFSRTAEEHERHVKKIL